MYHILSIILLPCYNFQIILFFLCIFHSIQTIPTFWELRLYFLIPSKYHLNYILTKSKPNLPSSFLSCWALNSSNVTHCGWKLLCCFDFTRLRLGEDGDPSPDRQLVHNYLLRGAEDVVTSYKASWINMQCYESHVWGNKWVKTIGVYLNGETNLSRKEIFIVFTSEPFENCMGPKQWPIQSSLYIDMESLFSHHGSLMLQTLILYCNSCLCMCTYKNH